MPGLASMVDTADTLKPVPVRRRSAARLAAVQMSYQGQMSGQSVAEFLPVFLQHYSEDIRKSFRVKDIDSGHLNELAASVESRSEELDEVLAGCLASGWSLCYSLHILVLVYYIIFEYRWYSNASTSVSVHGVLAAYTVPVRRFSHRVHQSNSSFQAHPSFRTYHSRRGYGTRQGC